MPRFRHRKRRRQKIIRGAHAVGLSMLLLGQLGSITDAFSHETSATVRSSSQCLSNIKPRTTQLSVMPLSTTDEDKQARRRRRSKNRVKLASNKQNSTTADQEAAKLNTTPLLDLNTSGSIGSLLMQMQKREEEMRQQNNSSTSTLFLSEEQALDLDPPMKTKRSATTKPSNEPVPSSQLDEMDYATAKKLDDSVSIRLSKSIGRKVQVLETPELYQIIQSSSGSGGLNGTNVTSRTVPTLPPLSQPEHYDGRIGRDMRHLAISIASSVTSVDDWRLWNEQIDGGGVRPLLECIREGAAMVRSKEPWRDESLMAASASCRTLRDLSAMSLELRAVLTDSLLRAHRAEALMPDLLSLQSGRAVVQYTTSSSITICNL